MRQAFSSALTPDKEVRNTGNIHILPLSWLHGFLMRGRYMLSNNFSIHLTFSIKSLAAFIASLTISTLSKSLL